MEPVGSTEDPLGLKPDLVEIETLTRWNKTEVPEYDLDQDWDASANKENTEAHLDFKCDPKINAKMVLWEGDLTLLNSMGIVNSTNEALNEKNILSERIFKKAGPDIKKEIKNEIRVCKTGEAKMTKGYMLPSRYVLHTVGPRYNIKYKTAAECALFNSYRNVLQIAREQQLTSVAFCCIHTLRRGYPPEEGAHIALRTIRRFLEKFGETLHTVILVVTEPDTDYYIKTMPLYFPRTANEEAYSNLHLPDDVGNEDGEPVVAERQIRILDKPALHTPRQLGISEFEETLNINEEFETSVAVGQHAFARMEKDPDAVRKKRHDSSEEAAKVENQKRYERLLRRARQEDLSDIQAYRCIYQSGFDNLGRPVIVFVGRHFPADSIDLNRAMLYFIHVLDSLVSQHYVIVYLHTLTANENLPEMGYLRHLYNIADNKYRKNLRALYIVHPTFWSKVASWFFTTFTVSDLKTKVHNISGVQYLYHSINPSQLDIPPFVMEYDRKINGVNYYRPQESAGGL